MKFIVDFMLGRLCRWLRALGYDTLYFVPKSYQKKGKISNIITSEKKNGIILYGLKEDRVIITRDHRLSSKRALKIVVVKYDKLDKQMKQVFKELKLDIKEELIFSRCLICNTSLEEVKKERIKDRVPSYVFETHERFSVCPNCEKVYWKGTHWELIRDKIGEFSLDKIDT